ncbi:MAG: chromosome segregation protein SMC [Desulfobacteraceae bacterium IS3]|nr:MAG: chromosome segregation protein SMC [Desulfobacteraceae bacterium IS3]HAO21559.1 chromosome segregation protein SMC [Desulfobacteraceae bacterium]
MRIESIRIQNYKVFKDSLVKNLPKMSVFLGPNGSGKTTFFDVFGFLSDALQHNVTIALNRRGGFSEVISRDSKPHDLIKFEIKFRNPQPDKSHAPLVTYSLEIGFESGKAFINKEVLKYRRGQKTGQPWHFLNFRKGEGYAIINEEEYGKEGAEGKRDFQKVASPDILALKGLGQFEKFKIISSFRAILERWYISNFKTEYGRNISETGISEHLSITGHNLAQVSKYMYDYHRDTFDTILEKLPKRIPGINKVEAKETEDGMILLRFQDKNFKMPFLSKFVSDGTIKMFAYLVLLHDPNPHPLLCIEEPENFLYPDLLLDLCEEIREYSERGGQVLISTHSPDFVNGVRIEELFFLIKENGYTTIKSASDDQVVKELAKENQLGWLWRNRYIRGANLK